MLAVTLLCAMVLTGARFPVQVFAFQAAPTTSPQGEIQMGASEIDFLKWGFTQGGLTLLLLVVLISYRRDFFRKIEGKQAELDAMREDRRELVAVLDKNATAMTNQAVAVQANTKATELLAQNVNNLGRNSGHR